MFIRVCSWDQPVEGIGVEGSKTGQRMSQDTVPTSAPDSPGEVLKIGCPSELSHAREGAGPLYPLVIQLWLPWEKGGMRCWGRPFSVPEDCQPAVSQSLKGDGRCLSPSSHHMLVWLEKSGRKWAQRGVQGPDHARKECG